MDIWLAVFTIIGVWLLTIIAWYALIMPRLRRGPGDPVISFLWHLIRFYARWWHRLETTGTELLENTDEPGPLIIVSNHTGSVDPLLIQASCRYNIRWMMAEEQMAAGLHWLWRKIRVIPVARHGRDSGPAREAIRHVRDGGVLGIFPEGVITWPPEQIRPFRAGVGLIVARSKARVLLVWVSGTPKTTDMISSLTRRSRARVHFADVMDFSDTRDADEITERIRGRLAEVTGWPLNDEVQPPTRPNPDPFATRKVLGGPAELRGSE